jgi:tetratricopeptide (TPR) repeat protein
LHGTCDRVSSIITIISQYLGGLNRRTRRAFEAAIQGNTVIVVGYSGRDLDIMPILVEGGAAAIKWIMHKGPPSPEVIRACAVLGNRLELVPAHTGRWLKARLIERGQLRTNALPMSTEPKRLPMPKPVRRAFTAVAPAARNWAVAKVYEQLGRHDQALAIYQRLSSDPSVDQPRLLADLGRATARVAGHDAACRVFTSLLAQPEIAVDTRASALLGRLDALRNSSRPVDALRDLAELDRLLEAQGKMLKARDRGKRYWHFMGWSLSAKAGIHRIEGRAKAAAHLYARAGKAFSLARDIDGRIEVLTWQAESLLIVGDYRAALATADQAISYAVAYAKDLVRGWPRYVRAEALALSGRCVEALKEAARAQKVLRASGNIQGPLWCLLLKSDCYRETSPSKAARVMSGVRKGLGLHKLAHVQARLHLEEAELARAAVNWPRLNKALAKLRAHLVACTN